jgi:O-glycosyl hydrolase
VDIIGDFSNGATTWFDWNLILEKNGGPSQQHLGPVKNLGACDAPLRVDIGKDTYVFGTNIADGDNRYDDKGSDDRDSDNNVNFNVSENHENDKKKNDNDNDNHNHNHTNKDKLKVEQKQEVIYGVSYYYMGHFSKFILPGSSRIDIAADTGKMDASKDNFLYIAFISPDRKRITIVVQNRDKENNQHFILNLGEEYNNLVANLEIPKSAIQTLYFDL